MIIISPYSRQLRDGRKDNPKNYPYWNELVELILDTYPKQTIIQVGITGEEQIRNTKMMINLSLNELKNLIKICDIWISIDNFFHHLASSVGKRGIVLFGVSDPLIFGNPENINILKDRKYLRKDQFIYYEDTKYNPEAFVKPEKVMPYFGCI
jgi:ADP-heptose:LPS heptosyltransferase